MIDIPVKNCCGCTACCQICPVNAIRMRRDKEGFAYPVVDQSICVACGKCESVCPVNTPLAVSSAFHGCVIAQNTNEHVLRESTSGGFMDALNRFVLEDCGGQAAGVAFDDHFLPIHKIVSTVDEAAAFRNSKYAQSELGNTFQQVRSFLESGTCVVFTGTPCQVVGLKAFLGKDYDGLITADLICRSIPSPHLWRQYLDWQEDLAGSPIREVACRRKTYGYHHGALEILFENGTKYAGSNRVDYYMKAFHSGICSRPSCYDCPFKTAHRCSDFTVFDCGHPEEVTLKPMTDDDRGFSAVLIHTLKGKAVLDRLQDIRWMEADPEKLFRYTGGMESRSITRPAARENFYAQLDADGFYATVKMYVKVSFVDRILEAVKPLWFWIRKRSLR